MCDVCDKKFNALNRIILYPMILNSNAFYLSAPYAYDGHVI